MFPETEQVLRVLHKQYRIAVISNTITNAPRFVLKQSGLTTFVDIIVLSNDIGIRKPDPKIFRYALRRFSIKPYEATRIGDSLEADIVGAMSVGLKTVWINREKEKTALKPDFVIYSLDELLDQSIFKRSLDA